MKKYIIVLTVFFIAFTSCNKSNKNTGPYEVIGEISGIAGSNVIMMFEDPNTPEGFRVDSLNVTEDKFVFKGEIDSIRIAMIAIDNPALMQTTAGEPIPPNPVQFFIEPNTTTFIKGNVAKMHLSQLGGSKMNDQMNQLIRFTEIQQSLVDSMVQLMYYASTGGFDTEELEDSIRSEYLELVNLHANFVSNNPDLDISSFIIRMYLMQFYDPSDVMDLYNSLSNEVKSNFYGQLIAQELALSSTVTIGAIAPGFMLTDMHDKEIRLSDFTGNYLIIDFWASWCSYCRENHPKLVDMYHKYQNKGLNILSISGDTEKEKWLAAIKEDNLSWTQINALTQKGIDILGLYGVKVFPTTIVISPEGEVVDVFEGEDPKLYEFIESIFSE